MINKFAANYYKYAQKEIVCACPLCQCPAQDGVMYSFVYVHEHYKLIYFDVPKCASTTIRTSLFDGDNSFSMKNPETELADYFKFTFVRNPWDRMVSNWKMFTSNPMRIKQLQSMTGEDLTKFEDFILFSEHTKNHHWQPQVLYLPETLDFIGRLENFNTDFQQVLRHIGKTNIQSGHENQTQRKNYQEYYTPSTIELVGRLYEEDIKAFGYSYD